MSCGTVMLTPAAMPSNMSKKMVFKTNTAHRCLKTLRVGAGENLPLGNAVDRDRRFWFIVAPEILWPTTTRDQQRIAIGGFDVYKAGVQGEAMARRFSVSLLTFKFVNRSHHVVTRFLYGNTACMVQPTACRACRAWNGTMVS